ncbi:MAG: hypothetical protein C0593_14065 [Marinilabiliales bacterium]|nr:MAG: hypothetical protein C0593_14065 [Marinilabiliales bacterium]
MVFKRGLFFILIVAIGLFTGCDPRSIFDDDDDPEEVPENPFITISVSGQLTIPEDCFIDPLELDVISITDKQEVASDGTFTVEVLSTEKSQVLLFNTSDGETIFMGVYNPDDGTVMADATSTALALTLFTDYLYMSEQADRNEYFVKIMENPKFNTLLESLGNSWANDPYHVLNYDYNVQTYQLVVELIKETFETLGTNDCKYEIGDPPTIEDASGTNIKFVNNRYIYYASGVYPDGSSTLSKTVTVERKESITSFDFGWPPVYMTDPEETLFDLGNGSFRIELKNGMQYANIFDIDNPDGRATLYNTGQGIWYVLEILVSLPGIPDMATLPNYLTLTPDHMVGLGNCVMNRNTRDYLLLMMDVIAHNDEEIAYWIFQEFQTNAAHHYINSAAAIMKNVGLVFKLLGFVNEQGPFFFDVIFAPEVTYFVTQENGVITSISENNSPVAMFSADPPAGIIGTNITFDASASNDDTTPLSDLKFRWDFTGDQNWTSWSASPTIEYSYAEAGSYSVVLEVQDADGQVGFISHVINIGGGSGSANHIKLFMDVYPWDNDAMLQVFAELGFTEGIGADKYEIITSAEMAAVELLPGEDLVIISNDQPQSFYDMYAASQVKFSDFVYNGGALFWEACDGGWNDGYIETAGIIMPGNIELVLNYDYYNYVANPHLPLVAGLPETMDHNYASHEYFGNFPDGTIVYCTGSNGNPTLIEFNLGLGWILVSGQPLEHQYVYVYGNDDMQELLPRIVSYFTGKEFIGKRHQMQVQKSTVSSHK